MSGVPSVLVTGAGGFIGSALVDRLTATGNFRVVSLDSSPDRLTPRPGHHAVAGSVCDAPLLDRLFQEFQPTTVYHAAALKHVPALEFEPFAAIRTNALGTYTLANTALRHRASQLILVSTDKAVNPRSIMGASKRLAELTVTALSGSVCRMNALRLGNVSASTGSVIPIFLDRIAQRLPVAVTDPRATRYFLSLREAVDAIVSAGDAVCSGRILLPDLGVPVSIVDLARSLAHAAANSDAARIPIAFTGLRPGEKLTEDLLYESEIREGRVSDKLEVIRTPSPALPELHARMEQLARLTEAADLPGLIAAVVSMIPEYRASSVILEAMISQARNAGTCGEQR